MTAESPYFRISGRVARLVNPALVILGSTFLVSYFAVNIGGLAWRNQAMSAFETEDLRGSQRLTVTVNLQDDLVMAGQTRMLSERRTLGKAKRRRRA